MDAVEKGSAAYKAHMEAIEAARAFDDRGKKAWQKRGSALDDLAHNVNITGRNFAALVAGLPGDLGDILPGAGHALLANMPNSEEMAEKLGGDPSHWSWLPAALATPGPGEFKAILSGVTPIGVARLPKLQKSLKSVEDKAKSLKRQRADAEYAFKKKFGFDYKYSKDNDDKFINFVGIHKRQNPEKFVSDHNKSRKYIQDLDKQILELDQERVSLSSKIINEEQSISSGKASKPKHEKFSDEHRLGLKDQEQDFRTMDIVLPSSEIKTRRMIKELENKEARPGRYALSGAEMEKLKILRAHLKRQTKK